MFNLPQVKRYLISIIKRLCIRVSSEVVKGFWGCRKLRNIRRIQNCMKTDPCRNKTLEIAVKTFTKSDSKAFWPWAILLHFFTLLQLFWPGLLKNHRNHWSNVFFVAFSCQIEWYLKSKNFSSPPIFPLHCSGIYGNDEALSEKDSDKCFRKYHVL